MQTIKRRESVYTNQGGASAAQPQSIGSRQGVGNTFAHTQSLREKQKNAARSGDDHASANPRQRGGQASNPGLFGLPSATGRTRCPKAPTPAKVPAQGQAPRPQVDDQPSRVGGLTFAQRRSVIRSRVDLAVVSLGRYERRPVPAGPSMGELIAAQRARTASQSNEDTASEPEATSAMLRAAYASDMREAFPHVLDDDSADFARRCAGAGYVEVTLATES